VSFSSLHSQTEKRSAFLQVSQTKISPILSNGRGFGVLFSVAQVKENIAATSLEISSLIYIERAM